MVYNDYECFYVLCSGELRIRRNGDIISSNTYRSKNVQDCLNYLRCEK